MALKEIKPKRPKSHRALIALLQAAISEARSNQYTAIALSMKGKTDNYVVHFIVDGTDINSVVGLCEDLKDEVKKSGEYVED